MNEGSEIVGNRNDLTRGGGGITISGSNITIRGGLISENSSLQGGGICIGSTNGFTYDSTVTMYGGIISKNSSRIIGGGGIYIDDSDNRFIKRTAPGSNTSGIIYGSDGGTDANTISSGQGAAIYIDYPRRKRNSTLGLNDEISTLTTAGWE